MKYIKSFESKLNEMGVNYSTLGEEVPFEEVVEFLRDYKEGGSVACLGYSEGEGDNRKIITVPFESEPVFDPHKNYCAFLRTVDTKERGKKKLEDASSRDSLMKLLNIATEVRNGLYSMNVDEDDGSDHSYIWPGFDEDGNLYGADKWGFNSSEWFTDGLGLYSEHSDEYQEFCDEEDEDIDDGEE